MSRTKPDFKTTAKSVVAEFIRRTVRNEESAIRAIIKAHNRWLYRAARSIVRDDGEAEICADPLKSLRNARKSTSLILSFSDVQLAEFINRKRAQRPLTRFVHMLNKILAGHREDRELGLMALRRMALEPAG